MNPIYATPRPQYPPRYPPGLKIHPQSQASSSRSQTPWHPSPISTPGYSETTYDSTSDSNVVHYDQENLVRTLGLSQRDIAAADTTSWEAPSFSAWVTQHRAQEAHDKYSGAAAWAKTPRAPSLNPHAGEFVPLVGRERDMANAQAAGAPEVGTEVLRMTHPWMSKFRSGTSTTDPNVRKECARAIVRMSRWDAEAIRELASKFIERAMENDGDSMLSVAVFAKAIHDAFRMFGGGICTTAFRVQLMRCAWSDFEATWQMGSPSSFLTVPNKWPGKYLAHALAIVSFVGELFSCKLVDPGFVYQCLHLLVSDMVVIEQLRAARVLLCRLDYRLQEADPAAMNGALECIKRNVSRIIPGKSALGEAFDYATVKVQIDDIFAVADRWDRSDPKKVRRQPKECIMWPFSSDDEMDDDMTPRPQLASRPPSSNTRSNALQAPARIFTPGGVNTNGIQPEHRR
ncbi:hypothetical protein PYCCODRAFT_1459070 [Trametes coccinea BRFM310]|uniref:Uncharacterized protein n=1 Tax=Trametes coccinea (strain BRFM310) TaxID=1353009 RepID=A0A1Y2IMN0_TRAC3|nr:hypothetical protein PYCCODRAFT_1459070 [Trametes coccinea BRFM310]